MSMSFSAGVSSRPAGIGGRGRSNMAIPSRAGGGRGGPSGRGRGLGGPVIAGFGASDSEDDDENK
jgi:hypothetical protein